MKGQKRKRHGAGFKAKVALEAAKEQRTINELATEFRVHPTQISQWKKHLVENVAGLFSEGPGRSEREEEALRAELYQQIGKLQMELEWLKKKVGAEC